MIGILKQMWLRRPRLNRIWATVLNFLIVGIVSIHLWWMAGYPLFNAELEFRRIERTNLMPRSEILFSVSEEGERVRLSGGWKAEMNERWFVGESEGYATVALVHENAENRWIRRIPMEEEKITLIPLCDVNGYLGIHGKYLSPYTEGNVYKYYSPILLLNVPEEAESGELHVEEYAYKGDCLRYESHGGGWMALPSEALPYRVLGMHYTLKLYRADGSLLLEQNGIIP